MQPARTPRRRLPMTLALLLVATGLAACAVGARFETRQFAGAFNTSFYGFAAGRRDFHTVVVGNPFGDDDAAFGQRVTAILNERNTQQSTNFTTEPGPSARLQYKLVLLFNPAKRLTPNGLCRDTVAASVRPANAQAITVQAAFVTARRRQ